MKERTMKVPGLYTWQDSGTIYWSDDSIDVPKDSPFFQIPPMEISVVDLMHTLNRIEQLMGKYVVISFSDFFYTSQQGGELSDR